MTQEKKREILFLGRRYGVKQTDGRTVFLDHETIFVPPRFSQNFAKAFPNWAKDCARKAFQARLEKWSKKLGLGPKGFSLSNAQTRWGSCNSKGHLNLNWRLVLCPEMVMDYVIIHELTHLKYFNHSRQFWRAVAAACPKFEAARRWLKISGREVMELYRG